MRHVRVVVFVRLASACVIAAIRVSRLMPTAPESCPISRTACRTRDTNANKGTPNHCSNIE
jgi:hypothetical protein